MNEVQNFVRLPPVCRWERVSWGVQTDGELFEGDWVNKGAMDEQGW